MRRRPYRCASVMFAVVVCALAAGASVALAQGGPPPARGGFATDDAATVRVTGVISVDFREEPIQAVADKISRMVGVNVVVAPGIDQKVTIKLDNLPYEEVLREIASRANLVVVRKGNNLLRIDNPPRVSITFSNAEIKQAIDLLARQADVNVVVAEDIKGTVNLRLKNVPWEQALETLVKTGGYFLVRDESGLTRVITKEMLKDQQSTQVFVLRYIQPPSAYTAKIQTEFAVGQPKASVGELEQDFTLFKAIKSTLSETGQVQFD